MYLNFVGDNLDIYVRTSRQSSTDQHKDLHYFASNILFNRLDLTDLSTVPPQVVLSLTVKKITISKVVQAKHSNIHNVN